MKARNNMLRTMAASSLLAVLGSTTATAQVSAYTFSQEIGTWTPLAGTGSPLGMPGLGWPFTFDDNSFVTQGESLPLGSATTGNGWPIGFTFHFNGQAYDRVGVSMEGWLAFGKSADGINAVYVPAGSPAYTPLSSPVPAEVDPSKRNRVAGFSLDLAAMGNGGTWPGQLRTAGTAPNRIFVVEWNVVRSGGSNRLSFQVRLHEGGGDPAAQIVQVVFGTMVQTTAMMGQVGLGGTDPSDFNNRSITTSPFNWQVSEPGTSNTATCRPPAQIVNIPEGLTFTWTPPACVVSGIRVAGLGVASGAINGTLSWAAVQGATSYDYVITAGGPDDPPVASGSGLTTTTVDLADLPQDQALTAYVRADCGAGAGAWGVGFPFTTEGVVEVVCGQAPIQSTHCYADLEERIWYYSGTTEAPLRLIIHEGVMSVGDRLTLYDGPNDQAPVLFSSLTGPIAGQVANSTGRHLTMKLVADHLGSCDVHGVDPIVWEVGCVDCEPVLANYRAVDDCDNGRFSVAVDIFSLGSSASVSIQNNAGVADLVVNATGSYTVGPFTNGTPVLITAAHAQNTYCSSSMEVINGVCPVVGCGPATHTHCYSGEGRWAYSGDAPADRIGVRFLSGSLASGHQLIAYDGNDEIMDPVLGMVNGGDLTGTVFTSSEFSNTIMLQLVTNSAVSCESGAAAPWTYVVGCFDGCAAPQATFAVVNDCGNGRFSVTVDLASLGSASQVTIRNDRGVAQTVAAGAGQYTVGPFGNDAPVVLTIEGSSELCSVTSPALNHGCGVGIKEEQQTRLGIYPDPSEGAFNVVLPRGFGGRIDVEVLDLSGRRVLLERAMGSGGQVIPLSLDHVPAGSYVVIVRNDEHVASGTVRVMR